MEHYPGGWWVEGEVSLPRDASLTSNTTYLSFFFFFLAIKHTAACWLPKHSWLIFSSTYELVLEAPKMAALAKTAERGHPANIGITRRGGHIIGEDT